jgi:hypothetical protein
MSRALILRRTYDEGHPVAPSTVFHFRSLHVDELENAIGKMLERVEGGLGRVDAELRNQLLPALMVLRERVKPGHWEEFLRAHRFHPATVRKWRARQKASTESLLHLFGESRKIDLNEKLRLGETPAEALLKAAKRGFEELLIGDLKYGSEIAKEFLRGLRMARASPKVAGSSGWSASGAIECNEFSVLGYCRSLRELCKAPIRHINNANDSATATARPAE